MASGDPLSIPRSELFGRLQRLMFLRVLFVSLLLGASVFLQVKETKTAFGDIQTADDAAGQGKTLEAAVVKAFWSPEHGLFVNNRPWLDEEKTIRTCDRSLATAVLFDQCPKGNTAGSLKS